MNEGSEYFVFKLDDNCLCWGNCNIQALDEWECNKRVIAATLVVSDGKHPSDVDFNGLQVEVLAELPGSIVMLDKLQLILDENTFVYV